jgi:tetratricopeptide (TPR) repeat protein
VTDNALDSIVAVLESGDPGAAERLCRAQLQARPDASDLSVLLALSLWQQGHRDEAQELYARLTRLYPEEGVHWRNYAAVLRKAGDLETSEKAYEAAVSLLPDDAELLHLYGLVQMDEGKSIEARNTLLRAFGKAPELPAVRIHAALACIECRDLRADNLLRPWREWMPIGDPLQSELAEALARQGDVKSAVELLEGLVNRHPGDRPIRLRLAGLYERTNRLDDAAALLNSVDAESATANAQTSETLEIVHQRARLASRQRDYAAARAILERAGPRNDRDCAHWFDLAHACDKTDDVAAAMTALGHAHAVQAAEIKAAHPHWFEPDSGRLPNQTERTEACDYAKWPVLRAPDAMQSPVFVVGFPRSGTTLLEQMLDTHPRLQSMDERPFFNMLATQLKNSTGFEVPGDLGRLDQRDCDELRKGYLTLACDKVPRRWDTRLVDKNPLNMQWLPMIHRLFPKAKIIFALRHPCDVLLSNYMQNFMASSLGAACENLHTLSKAYVEVMEQWCYHVELFKPKVFISRYEELVTDPLRQTRRITEFLELEDVGTMLAFDQHAREKGFIATPSYTQVIEPINTKGLGRWLRYSDYFEPILPTLVPMLQRWGYTAETSPVVLER